MCYIVDLIKPTLCKIGKKKTQVSVDSARNDLWNDLWKARALTILKALKEKALNDRVKAENVLSLANHRGNRQYSEPIKTRSITCC